MSDASTKDIIIRMQQVSVVVIPTACLQEIEQSTADAQNLSRCDEALRAVSAPSELIW